MIKYEIKTINKGSFKRNVITQFDPSYFEEKDALLLVTVEDDTTGIKKDFPLGYFFYEGFCEPMSFKMLFSLPEEIKQLIFPVSSIKRLAAGSSYYTLNTLKRNNELESYLTNISKTVITNDLEIEVFEGKLFVKPSFFGFNPFTNPHKINYLGNIYCVEFKLKSGRSTKFNFVNFKTFYDISGNTGPKMEGVNWFVFSRDSANCNELPVNRNDWDDLLYPRPMEAFFINDLLPDPRFGLSLIASERKRLISSPLLRNPSGYVYQG
jgi:hypothetical protein